MRNRYTSATQSEMPPQKCILIVSAILDAWGGSEELWSACVPILQKHDFRVVVAKSVVHSEHPKIVFHQENGVRFLETDPKRTVVSRIWGRLQKEWKRKRGVDKNLPGFVQTNLVRNFKVHLASQQPSLVILSQGINFDGVGYAYACMEMGFPYVIISHKAAESFWPWPTDRTCMREIFLNARACFFVSQHNKRLTQEQFGLSLPHSKVIFNPVRETPIVPFPSDTSTFRICCIGRLVIVDKGQDILLRILSKPIWRARNIHLTIFGSGPDETGLKSLASYLRVDNVTFAGFADDLETLWKDQHALVVPSRCEGLPLTIVEAMKIGRPVITTNAGGSAEFIEDNTTGFVSHCSPESFEEAMERAWARRYEWKEIGAEAQKAIDHVLPAHPEQDFIDMLTEFL